MVEACASHERMRGENRTVLVLGMGTSPAVLTETVWALAHQEEPVEPDEIEVITTSSGKSALQHAILEGAPSVMDRLKAALRKEKIDVEVKLVFGTASIKVIPDAKGNELDDLRTGDDNLKTADFTLVPIQTKHSMKRIVSGSMWHVFCLLTIAKKNVARRYSAFGARFRTDGAATRCATGFRPNFTSARVRLG